MATPWDHPGVKDLPVSHKTEPLESLRTRLPPGSSAELPHSLPFRKSLLRPLLGSLLSSYFFHAIASTIVHTRAVSRSYVGSSNDVSWR